LIFQNEDFTLIQIPANIFDLSRSLTTDQPILMRTLSFVPSAGFAKNPKMFKRDVVKIPPTLHRFTYTCICIDCMGLPPGRRGGASAGSFDLIQYCYIRGEGEGRLPREGGRLLYEKWF
jgi:hypothetical protein